MAEQVYQVALSAADADNAITMTSGPGDAVSAEAAEAWAVGTRNGVPVESGDATYENHSKYWAGQAKHSQENANASYVQARAYANGTAGEYTITNDNGTSYRVPVDVGYEDVTLPNGAILRITKSAEGYANKAKKYAEIAAQYGDSNATVDGLTQVVTGVTYYAPSSAQMQTKGFKVTTKQGNNTATTMLVNLLNLKQDMGLGGALVYTDKGVANGLATLDSSGKVPASQLPSYVDDVLEYANLAAFPETGEGGKIYVAQDTSECYRWSGSAYIKIVNGDYALRTDTVLNTTLSRGRKANTTVGTGSFAFGYDVEASGGESQAFGSGTRARDENEIAVGSYNADRKTEVIWSDDISYRVGQLVLMPIGASYPSDEEGVENIVEDDRYFECIVAAPAGTCPLTESGVNTDYWKEVPGYVFTVGIGKWDEYRKNGFAVDNAGNGLFKGDVFVGTNDNSTGGTKLVKETELTSGLALKADKANPAFTGNGTISGRFTLGMPPTANMDAATKYYVDTAVTNKTEIDDTAGDGDTDVTWSADKLVDECFAVTTGAISSLPMTITDARITAECIVMDEMIDQQVDIGWVTTAGKLILYGTLPTGTTIASKKIKVKRCHGLTEDTVTLSIRFQASTSANGNYLIVDAGNLLPGTQYSWHLYKVVNGTETQVSGIGSTPSCPTASRWYQEATYNLEDGVTYKAKIWPTAQSSNVTTSGTVTFTAALTS